MHIFLANDYKRVCNVDDARVERSKGSLDSFYRLLLSSFLVQLLKVKFLCKNKLNNDFQQN